MKSKIMIIFIAFFYLCYSKYSYLSRNYLEVVFLDVGQGDAILVTTPGKNRILIDGGEGDGILSVLNDALPVWIKSIDVIVLTHPHSDHLDGLIDVVNRYKIKELWVHPVVYKSPLYQYWLQFIADMSLQYSINVISVTNEVDLYFGEISINVLWPLKNSNVFVSFSDVADFANCYGYKDCFESFNKNVNNDSIVLLLSYGNMQLLLMGDAEVEVEHVLLQTGLISETIQILKAGHHCSRTATGDQLLNRIKPELIICSCGSNNKFGHPHKEILESAKERGIEVLRTDLEGSIILKIYKDSFEN